MAVELQHNRDTSQFQYHDVLSHSQHHNNNNNNNNNSNKRSYLRALLRSTEVQKKDNEEDLIAELSHHMDSFMLQDDDKSDLSGNDSHNLELSWDLIGSPQSTVWSTLGSNQGSSEGSTSQEPSPPATPSWKRTHDVMKLGESDNSKYHQIQTLNTSKSNIDICSHQSLIQEQIRSIELSKLKQEHVVPLKQKQSAHGESEGQISTKKSEKKEKEVGNGRRTSRPPRPTPLVLQHLLNQQQNGPGMRAIFLGGTGSTSGGTGFFFPRSGTTDPTSKSAIKKQAKGCSTVLIPSRVVQALQLHFDQMSATSGSKAGAFPPLHDVLVSDRDGMYSLQKQQQAEEAPANSMQNETLLPPEWTY